MYFLSYHNDILMAVVTAVPNIKQTQTQYQMEHASWPITSIH
ncbi:hypothetical protein DDI_4019 [Dickeya dianthicola RNS04.9]|nr:hypothetical protein DDI_4019 [Dickeya dianthicola RNS04.9]